MGKNRRQTLDKKIITIELIEYNEYIKMAFAKLYSPYPWEGAGNGFSPLHVW